MTHGVTRSSQRSLDSLLSTKKVLVRPRWGLGNGNKFPQTLMVGEGGWNGSGENIERDSTNPRAVENILLETGDLSGLEGGATNGHDEDLAGGFCRPLSVPGPFRKGMSYNEGDHDEIPIPEGDHKNVELVVKPPAAGHLEVRGQWHHFQSYWRKQQGC